MNVQTTTTEQIEEDENVLFKGNSLRLFKIRLGLIPWYLRRFAGKFLNVLSVPGIIQPMEEDDLILKKRISIRLTLSSTILSIGNRDYYFDRLTGKFTGTGSCIEC